MTASMMQPWFPFTLNFPSGDVDLANWFSPKVEVSYAGTPEIERDVVERVASFGRQLGILTDALLEVAGPAKGEKLQRLQKLHDEVEAVKMRHRSDVARDAKAAIERLADLDRNELKALLRRYGT